VGPEEEFRGPFEKEMHDQGGRYMPTIMNQSLSISLASGSPSVRIELDIAWDEFERRAGQPYQLRAQLMGEDGTIFDPDDDLISILFPFETNGTATQRVSFRTLIPARELNEDGGEDEIYARLRITPDVSPFGSASARTSTVHVRL
jgi:hypothetical protein